MASRTSRGLCLMLVLSVSMWAQAVCPMMLFPQSAEHCKGHASEHAAASHGAAHECCPGMNARMEHEQCNRTAMTCAASMNCCSVERPPASTGKAVLPSLEIGVVGRVMASATSVPNRAAGLELSNEGPPIRGVLQLKEDLRI